MSGSSAFLFSDDHLAELKPVLFGKAAYTENKLRDLRISIDSKG